MNEPITFDSVAAECRHMECWLARYRKPIREAAECKWPGYETLSLLEDASACWDDLQERYGLLETMG